MILQWAVNKRLSSYAQAQAYSKQTPEQVRGYGLFRVVGKRGLALRWNDEKVR